MRPAPLFLLLAACTPGTEDASQPTEGTDATDVVDPTLARAVCEPAGFVDPPACGSGDVDRLAVIPGPAQAGFDSELAAKALRHDRLFHALFAKETGVNSELRVSLDNTTGREAIEAFLEGEGWDFEAVTDVAVEDVVEMWTKVAGAYAGVGIAADAFRYGTLRDEGAPCDDVDQARENLIDGLDGLHRAMAITGTPGVIARGYSPTHDKAYGSHVETTDLFDGSGNPLPEEKNNGTWRDAVENGSDTVEGYRWEDSCSRDMLMGWAMAFGAAWEVIGRDPTVPQELRDRLRSDATALLTSFTTVQESGYDLEVMDADGRRTFHGILHEESIDTIYAPGVVNGQNAAMSLGVLAALALASGDEDLQRLVVEHYLDERDLVGAIEESLELVDFGLKSNFSGYNMDFLGTILAQRYLCDVDAAERVGTLSDTKMYDIPERSRQPAEQSQGLYHLGALLGRLGGTAWAPASAELDTTVAGRLLDVLSGFPDAPFYNVAWENCDADELESGTCTLVDGTEVTVLGEVGRNEVLVSDEPVPMAARPPSNYFWRSNPYQLNGDGDGSSLYPAVDFRFVYWMGRWATPEPRE